MLEFKTIVDAWYELKKLCELCGYKQVIQRGSFEGCDFTYRRQYEPVGLRITDPLDFSMLPNTVTPGMIERYFIDYIISPTHPPGEKYSYGERINVSLDHILEMLVETKLTNQAIIGVYRPEDINLEYPPCLLSLQFMSYNNRLNMISYWRSNDISEAFLLNQGGLAMLLNMVAEYSSLVPGELVYFSGGPHVYVQVQ